MSETGPTPQPIQQENLAIFWRLTSSREPELPTTIGPAIVSLRL